MGRLGVHRRTRSATLCAAGARRTALLVRPDEPLRHGRRGRHDASSSSSWGGSPRWPGSSRSSYPGLLCHTANSAATLRGPRAHFDMVRTGIAMYGLAPAQRRPVQGRPAAGDEARARTSPACARPSPGDSVGYGRRFVADRARRASASCPIGYADGVRRALSNRGEVLVAGRRCRIVGTISMDQLTVRLPDDWGEAGRRGRVLRRRRRRRGRRLRRRLDGARRPAPATPPRRRASSARRWRGMLGTINYEVACDVAPRVVRRYRGAGPAA